ncbi:LIP [Symbiodinium pilosum]|uniref:LIP protein n=1 Tax=Symbiodinium pilosum TaxID=2952 RepID=A0A812WJ49_SYMPI|nr:LIP [Symbiodinium pilosum]
MADDAGATARTEESGGIDGDDDLFEYLELKRKEVAAMTQAAEIAREQAVHLLRLQRQVQAIESMAAGTGSIEEAGAVSAPSEAGAEAFDCPVHTSTLSLEDRRRFGLEATPPPSEVQMQSRRSDPSVDDNPQARSGQMPEEWTWQTQSAASEAPAESEETAPPWSSLSCEDRKRFGLDGQDLPPSQRMEAASGNPHLPTAVSRHAVSHHPDVLWGNAGMPGPPSMAKTLAQLEAVGMATNLSRLEETERKLQRLKLG